MEADTKIITGKKMVSSNRDPVKSNTFGKDIQKII